MYVRAGSPGGGSIQCTALSGDDATRRAVYSSPVQGIGPEAAAERERIECTRVVGVCAQQSRSAACGQLAAGPRRAGCRPAAAARRGCRGRRVRATPASLFAPIAVAALADDFVEQDIDRLTLAGAAQCLAERIEQLALHGRVAAGFACQPGNCIARAAAQFRIVDVGGRKARGQQSGELAQPVSARAAGRALALGRAERGFGAAPLPAHPEQAQQERRTTLPRWARLNAGCRRRLRHARSGQRRGPDADLVAVAAAREVGGELVHAGIATRWLALQAAAADRIDVGAESWPPRTWARRLCRAGRASSSVHASPSPCGGSPVRNSCSNAPSA